MEELNRIKHVRGNWQWDGVPIDCDGATEKMVLEIADIARKALEERDELKKDFTVSEDLRMVRERQLKHVMDQRDRLQRRLDAATEILENEFDIYDSGCHCFKDWTCRRCEARAWLEEVE